MTTDDSGRTAAQNTTASARWVTVLGMVAGWVWAVVAGGGGIELLWTKGPWPLTNGWFALASGISACPLTSWILKRFAGIAISWRVQLAFAASFVIAGRIALLIGIGT